MATYSDGSIVYEVSLDTKNLLENSTKVREELNKLSDNGEKASKGLDKLDKSAVGAGNSMGKLTTIAKAVSAALVSSTVIAYAQSWNELEDRIGNTGATAAQTKSIMDQLLATSNRNGRTIEESAELYIRLSNSMKELGYSSKETLDYIDTLSNLMTINKTNALSAQSAINGLTRAQMKGKLAGDDAMAVFNAMPSVLKTLGTQLNLTEAEVRKLAADGKLSMQDFSQAMIKAQGDTAALADNMRNTVNDGITRVTNNLKQYLGELNNTTGATKLLVDSLVLVSEHVDILATGVGVLAAIYAGKYITSLAAATKQSVDKVRADIRQAATTKQLATEELGALEIRGRELTARRQELVALKAVTTSKLQLAGITKQLNVIDAQRAALVDKETAAQARLSAAMKATALSTNVLKGAMNMLGGPAGVILIAVGALMSWASSADAARQKSLELGDSIGALTAKFDGLTEIQKKAEIAKLKVEMTDLNKQIENQAFLLQNVKDGYEAYQRRFASGSRFTSEEGLQKAEEVYLGELAKQEKLQGNKVLLTKTLEELNNKAVSSTNKLVESTGELNNQLGKPTIDNITKKVVGLAQETEIAELKQKGLTKEAYVYQAVLSTLGDEASEYQAALFKAVQTGQLFKDNIEGVPEQVHPLIEALSQLYDVNKSGAVKTNTASSKIKELKDSIAVARLEVKGAIEDAKALKALQDSKSSGGNASEIAQIVALTQQYEKLQLAKSGKSFAQDQVNNNLSESQKIAIEQQAKLDELNKWYDTGLANEQLYQDAYSAVIEEGAKKRKKLEDDEVAARFASTQAILSSSSDLFGGLADITKTFSSEQGAAYKAMFAISKGFAIANAALNLQMAISNASAAPWPTNFGFIAQAAAQGAQIASSISSLSYGGGREHGGSVGATSMYRVGEGNKPEILMSGGRQYMIPGESGKVISNKDLGTSSQEPSINWSINIIGGDSSSTDVNVDDEQKRIDIIVSQTKKSIAGDIRERSGAVYSALKDTTNIKPRL
ncbi:tape measure protein [Utexia brackfieldae]|uniref:tape measure protein n=1 Tax=Utexia brackfieldae TaxID=3074108 RepID=UPI00370DE2C0